MNEIEKLYELASFVKKRCKDYSCTVCEQYNDCEKYPPFTAEKQLELIKWLSNNDKDKNKKLTLYNSAHLYYFGLDHEPAHSEDAMWSYGESLGTTFEDGLASIINDLWQDLTEEQKQQVKGILE